MFCCTLAVALALGVGHVAEGPRVLFQERFDGKLAEGWTWLKRDDTRWRLREGGLELRVQPEQVNALARTVPDAGGGPYAIEVTLTSVPQPTQQYEQAGLFWYANGEPGPKFVKERIDGKIYVFPGKKEMAEETVTLRWVVQGQRYTAQYRPGGQGDFLTAYSDTMPAAEKGKLQVALTCFHGPADAEHWVRLKDFRIVRLAPK